MDNDELIDVLESALEESEYKDFIPIIFSKIYRMDGRGINFCQNLIARKLHKIGRCAWCGGKLYKRERTEVHNEIDYGKYENVTETYCENCGDDWA